MPAFPNLGGKTAQQANDILASGGWLSVPMSRLT